MKISMIVVAYVLYPAESSSGPIKSICLLKLMSFTPGPMSPSERLPEQAIIFYYFG